MTPEIYATRIDRINEALAGTIAVEHNDYKTPTEPERYLVIEKSDGNAIWAFDCASLKDCADEISGSDTSRTEVIILDLDELDTESGEPEELTPIHEVTSILGDGMTWQKNPLASPFSPRELANIVHLLQLQKPNKWHSLDPHKPLEPSEIDSLCERLSAATPGVNHTALLYRWLEATEADRASLSHDTRAALKGIAKPESVNADLLAACKASHLFVQAATEPAADDHLFENPGEDARTALDLLNTAIARAEAAL